MPVLFIAGNNSLLELSPFGELLFYSSISVIVVGMDMFVDLNDFLSSSIAFSWLLARLINSYWVKR